MGDIHISILRKIYDKSLHNKNASEKKIPHTSQFDQGKKSDSPNNSTDKNTNLPFMTRLVHRLFLLINMHGLGRILSVPSEKLAVDEFLLL